MRLRNFSLSSKQFIVLWAMNAVFNSLSVALNFGAGRYVWGTIFLLATALCVFASWFIHYWEFGKGFQKEQEEEKRRREELDRLYSRSEQK